MVASGPVQNGYLIFSDSNECPCEKCDPNHAGYCLCENENKIGQVCQINIEKITGNSGSFTLEPLDVKRVMFSSNQQIDKIISKSSYPGLLSTIWASDNCHISLSEYQTNGETQDEQSTKEKGTDVNFGSRVCVAIFNNNDIASTYNLKISTHEPKKKKGGSSSNNDSADSEVKTSSLVLGNFEINNIYIGATSIVDFKLGYDVMRNARKLIGHVIPPPSFLHLALWVGSSNDDDESLGAVFVYGKYYPKRNNDQTFLSKDGARSYVMKLGEFKEFFNACELKKLSPKRHLKLFDFIEEVKMSGQWNADSYNWPSNNCQNFAAKCLNILHAVRDSPTINDWANIPPSIMNILKSNENNDE